MTELDDYVPVAERLGDFYARYPSGRIVTRLVEHSFAVVIVKALVYRTVADSRPSATGWAAERPGDGEINTVACLENTETSAIGRALANLGFLAHRSVPAGESPTPHSADTSDRRPSASSPVALGVRTVYGIPRVSRPARRESPGATPAVTVYVERQPAVAPPESPTIVRDLVKLLRDAEQHGLRRQRVARWTALVEANPASQDALERFEHWLRVWILKSRMRATDGRRD